MVVFAKEILCDVAQPVVGQYFNPARGQGAMGQDNSHYKQQLRTHGTSDARDPALLLATHQEIFSG